MKQKRAKQETLTPGEVVALQKAGEYYLDCWQTLGGKDFEHTAGLTNR